MKTYLQYAALALALAALGGCATQDTTAPAKAMPAAAAPAAAAPAMLFAVLPESGRIHAFGDTKNYFDFLAHGEVMLTRTQIGAGPGGKTLVYGITKADVKANQPSPAERLMTAAASPAGFYGEVFKNGRFYLFGDLKEMKDFISFGEVAYGYTDIGVGPKGESLVYVMNKASYKQGKPTDRGERFKSLRMAAK
jgi:hypothetical protein